NACAYRVFFFSSRRRHTRFKCDWSSDVCSSDLDYDLEELEKATPRDVDGILVTQGFRDLVDDARGILTELIAAPPAERRGSGKEIGRASCRERGGVWEAGGGWRYEGGRCGA